MARPKRHFGCIIDHDSTDRVLGRLPAGLFGDAAAPLKDTGAQKLSIPYASLLKLFCQDVFATEEQTTGDCTSHGCRNAHDISRAVEIDIRGEPEGFHARGACEPIYGARGHTGQGMDPARASDWVNKYGIVERGVYGDVDLSEYDSSKGSGWGSFNRGMPEHLKEEAQKHPVRTIALVGSVEEARDALHNGYGLHIGSNQGFKSVRDEDGFCRASGSWSHDMAVVGCDFTPDRRAGFVIANSWGDWVGGGHPWWGEMPPGCFLCDTETFENMLRSRGCWALSDVEGYPPKQLPDYGFGGYL